MITQAMKKWFRKMFAWWPWKQSAPFEYEHVAGAVTSQAAPETTYLWTSRDGTVPQAGATPRRFTLDSRAERLAPDSPPYATPVAFFQAGTDPTSEAEESHAGIPTPVQRLEFLRYLVQRGIVNEGFEHDEADSAR